MDTMQAIRERHSVRAYTTKQIESEKRAKLNEWAKICSLQGGIRIRMQYDDSKGFDSAMAHYGKFKNVHNYMILSGKKSDDLEERCGYYGEKMVLEAQKLGLNTCWVALTFNKHAVKKMILSEETLVIVIAVGYGEDQGMMHKGKSVQDVTVSKGVMPDWFYQGAQAAVLAPTALNQQKFCIGIKDGEPVIRISGFGFYTKIDLGIVKYHFEAASGRKVR